MAAPPSLLDECPAASPELALVDAALAAELRMSLPPVQDGPLRPRADSRDTSALLESDPLDELVDAVHSPDEPVLANEHVESQSAEATVVDDHVLALDGDAGEDEQTRSYYPPLPKLEPDALDDAEAALGRIRERLTAEAPAPGRRFRRGFTAAAVASVPLALAIVSLDVQFGLVRLSELAL